MTSWFYRQGISAWKFSSWEAFLLENFQVEKHLSLTGFKLRSYSAWKWKYLLSSTQTQLDNFQLTSPNLLNLRIFKLEVRNCNWLYFDNIKSLSWIFYIFRILQVHFKPKSQFAFFSKIGKIFGKIFQEQNEQIGKNCLF